jgi:hypothetical protein
MKAKFSWFLMLGIALIMSCKKKSTETPAPAEPIYSSLSDFYSENGVPLQTFTIDATKGGSFTTSKGTIVNIPANAFVTQTNWPVTGSVTIQFKDIYKKSDMLLSNVGTTFVNGAPLKSGGEFFIKAISNDTAVSLAPGKKIEVTQPIPAGQTVDNSMKAMVLVDTTHFPWIVQSDDTILYSASDYVFNMYSFSDPVSNGTWCNSDNPDYFSQYTQTTINITPSDTLFNQYLMDVFLVFKGINCMVHVYEVSYGNGPFTVNFPYNYAPVGFECTAVAICVKNGVLYSSFTPITISEKLNVSFSLSQTTTDAFKNTLTALD